MPRFNPYRVVTTKVNQLMIEYAELYEIANYLPCPFSIEYNSDTGKISFYKDFKCIAIYRTREFKEMKDRLQRKIDGLPED